MAQTKTRYPVYAEGEQGVRTLLTVADTLEQATTFASNAVASYYIVVVTKISEEDVEQYGF